MKNPCFEDTTLCFSLYHRMCVKSGKTHLFLYEIKILMNMIPKLTQKLYLVNNK